MSPTKNKLPDLAEIQQRFATACDLKQTIDRTKIVECFTRWLAGITSQKLPVKFIETFEEAKKYSRDARDAWDARAARDARDAWDARAARAARDAWDARAARAARDARAARAARAAWAAWAARAARDARAARAAVWDNSWTSIMAVGALSRADEKVFTTWMPLLEAFEAGAWIFYITKTEIAVGVIPQKTAVDDQRRLHNETGPAFSWADVHEYYWHGVRVTEDVIMRPEKITLAMIDNEANSEVRRVLITRYGMSRWLIDSKTEPIHTDKTGVLYRREVKGNEPIVMVRVVNSTKEKGIGYREFFMPVDPQLRPLPPGRWSAEKKREWLQSQTGQEMTAHNAVASTWGMRGEDYMPGCQT